MNYNTITVAVTFITNNHEETNHRDRIEISVPLKEGTEWKTSVWHKENAGDDLSTDDHPEWLPKYAEELADDIAERLREEVKYWRECAEVLFSRTKTEGDVFDLYLHQVELEHGGERILLEPIIRIYP